MASINPKINPELNHLIYKSLEEETLPSSTQVKTAKLSGSISEPFLDKAPAKLLTEKDAKAITQGETKLLSFQISLALISEKQGPVSNIQKRLLDEVRNLPNEVVDAFTPEKLAEFPINVLQNLPTRTIRGLSQSQYDKVMEKRTEKEAGAYDLFASKHADNAPYTPPKIDPRPPSPNSVTNR